MTTVQVPLNLIDEKFREKLCHGVFVSDICPQLNQIVSVEMNGLFVMYI